MTIGDTTLDIWIMSVIFLTVCLAALILILIYRGQKHCNQRIDSQAGTLEKLDGKIGHLDSEINDIKIRQAAAAAEQSVRAAAQIQGSPQQPIQVLQPVQPQTIAYAMPPQPIQMIQPLQPPIQVVQAQPVQQPIQVMQPAPVQQPVQMMPAQPTQPPIQMAPFIQQQPQIQQQLTQGIPNQPVQQPIQMAPQMQQQPPIQVMQTEPPQPARPMEPIQPARPIRPAREDQQPTFDFLYSPPEAQPPYVGAEPPGQTVRDYSDYVEPLQTRHRQKAVALTEYRLPEEDDVAREYRPQQETQAPGKFKSLYDNVSRSGKRYSEDELDNKILD